MKHAAILEMNRKLWKSISLDLSVNDLRILVGCLRALEYWSQADDEPYLDSDGLRLKERVEGLYRDELHASDAPKEGELKLSFGS